MKHRAALLLYILCVLPAAPEQFRVRGVIAASYDREDALPVRLGEALAVFLPPDRTFIRGIEFNITIPPEVADFPGSAVYGFYDELIPPAAAGSLDYTGTRRAFDTFPPRTGLLLAVPCAGAGALNDSPYVRVMPFAIGAETGAVFLRFQLAMKGVPDEVINAVFTVKVRALYADTGRLMLRVEFPEGAPPKPYTVFIDETAAAMEGAGIIMSAGTHTVSIVSDFYRNETRTVTVLRGQTAQVAVALKDIAPTLFISAPEGAEIFLDGEKIGAPPAPFVIAPGEHSVRFVLGGYETVQAIHAVNGKSYEAAMELGVNVTETP